MAHLSRLAVLAGGISAEREISLESGAQVATALQQAGFPVTMIDPGITPVRSVAWNQFDLACLTLHGTYGEDGTIQAELNDLGVKYTGSGPTASRLAFHKVQAKQIFTAHGLLTPDSRPVPQNLTDAFILMNAEEMGYPLVVKPEAQGSSLGVSLVTNPDQLLEAVELARDFDDVCLMERAIAGEEWTVPVLDNQILPPIRITTQHEFFDFTAKYEDEMTCYDVMADLQDPQTARVAELAKAAALSLGCRGLSRVDLRVDPYGVPWLLEVNTLPGMTAHSLVPKSAAALGWTMSDLCVAMVNAALRAPIRARAA